MSEGTLQTYMLQRKSFPKDKQAKVSENTSKYNKNTEYHTQQTRKVSPESVVQDKRSYEKRDHRDDNDRRQSVERTTEYSSSYSYNERRTSSDYVTNITKREQSPELRRSRENSPGKYKQRKSSPEKDKPRKSSPEKAVQRRISPERRISSKPETKEQFTKLRKTVAANKTQEDDKPEWVKQRNLRKTSETSTLTSKKNITQTTKITKKDTRSSPKKEIQTTDLITSSYGVGPTDENGAPLFGLKALRAQNKSTTKGKNFLFDIFIKIYSKSWRNLSSELVNLYDISYIQTVLKDMVTSLIPLSFPKTVRCRT